MGMMIIPGNQESKSRRTWSSLNRNWERMRMTSTWRKTSTTNILMPQNTLTLRGTGSQWSPSGPDERERLPYDEQENRQSHLESAKLRGGTVTMSPQPHQFSPIFQA